MIKQLKLHVETLDAERRLHFNWGYVLYGLIAERANPDYMAYLHQQNFTPINQYLQVLPNGQEGIWTINLLGQQAVAEIGAIFTENTLLEVRHHQTPLKVTAVHSLDIGAEEDFCRDYLVERPLERKKELVFLTPCSFKSQEQYQILPRTDLIIKSLLRSWQGFAQTIMLEDEETQQHLIDHLCMTDYQLRSVYYPVKGNKIPSFLGKITLQIAGPEPLARLCAMLLDFSQYSGVGIKTSLGMGGCQKGTPMPFHTRHKT